MFLLINQWREERSKEVSDLEKWKGILYLLMVQLFVLMTDFLNVPITVKVMFVESVEVS